MDGRYNTRSPAVKRLMREAQELSEPTDQYFAQPLDDNLFEWHFTIRGPADSDFQNGIYHGRIILPVDYPMKPPSIIWLTPNGRFETNKKICLSISGHHPESWQPSWSIRTALLAIIGFMPTHPGGAIGSLDYTPDERKVLAKRTKDWNCPTCGEVTGILLDVSESSEGTSNEAKELAAQINLQGEKPKCKEGECPIEQARLAEMQSKRVDTASESQASQSQSTNSINKGDNNSSSAGNSNTSTEEAQNVPLVTTPTSTLSTPAVSQQYSFPQFPPWSPYAMPPAGFPFHFPGVGYPNMPPVMPMQFPYPPSHYSSIPQSNWSVPPNIGMFPGAFPPPPPFSSPHISTNNSSNPDSNGDISPNRNGQTPSNVQYSRTPMTCPVMTSRPQPTTSINDTIEESRTQKDDESCGKRVQVFHELLTKVKRVGSDENSPQEAALSSTDNSEEASSSSEKQKSKPGRSQGVGDQPTTEVVTKHAVEGGTDSEVSKSLKKPEDKSFSEFGEDTNTEDNSEADVPPIEAFDADQRCALEKNACSSTSELERGKQKYQSNKGLRQRQSAIANVSTEVTEEMAAEPERSEDSAVRQRIEAASGDTAVRNRPRAGVQRIGNNLHLLNLANDRQNQARSYDLTFFLMAGLFTTSVLILFNRLAMVDWSGIDWSNFWRE